jgi:hypothetical protein
MCCTHALLHPDRVTWSHVSSVAAESHAIKTTSPCLIAMVIVIFLSQLTRIKASEQNVLDLWVVARILASVFHALPMHS